ncbi:hypothetical protein PoB_004701900 [Plakobranchus ocellatus]|uniref:Uncharacterized protein n=1 Tax=Plakobranchus ocellatus TaxID=259542 RepID=A0AAV4BNU2_9GAST|nr:hypothetical protein PoB_004701900 [Plakobranchus ocellatus]
MDGSDYFEEFERTTRIPEIRVSTGDEIVYNPGENVTITVFAPRTTNMEPSLNFEYILFDGLEYVNQYNIDAIRQPCHSDPGYDCLNLTIPTATRNLTGYIIPRAHYLYYPYWASISVREFLDLKL